jgi:D-alanyl-D-alanine carboxypeptidase (penicillin-binding protein 5/6)
LLDYGFNNYSYKQFANSGDVLKQETVYKGITPSVNLIYEENSGTLIKKGEDKNIEEIINIDSNISAPIYKGQKLGEITYTLNGNIISTVNLVAENDVKKLSISNMFDKLFLAWFKLLR